jgi:hypothetical protein
MALPYPYLRTWRFAKDHLKDLGLITVGNIVFTMALQMVALFMILGVYAIMIIGTILLVAGMMAAILVSPILVIFLMIIMAMVMLIITVLINVIQLLIMGASYGWNIYLTEKISDTVMGRSFSIGEVIPELRSRWKELFCKGLVLGLIFIVFLFLFIGILDLFFVIMMIPAIIGIIEGSPAIIIISFTFVFLAYVLIFVVILALSPILNFVFERTVIRIARGENTWKGFKGGLKDINRKGSFKYYYVGMLAISLAILLMPPLSTLISWVLPIASKTFLLVNDDL